MKDYAEKFYKGTAWHKCRAAYLKSVGGLCERCMSNGLFVPAVIVHHKIHITPENIDDPNIILDWNNLEALCRDCHHDEHKEFGAKRLGKRYFIDDSGRVIGTDEEIFSTMTPPVNDEN